MSKITIDTKAFYDNLERNLQGQELSLNETEWFGLFTAIKDAIKEAKL